MNTDKIFADAIANEYFAKNTSKIVALKKLDRKAKSKAKIFADSFGIRMSLVPGVGMCLRWQLQGFHRGYRSHSYSPHQAERCAAR